MILINSTIINAYSIVFLLIIYAHSIKHDDKVSMNSKLYRKLIQITILLLFFDIISRFDGKPDTYYSLLNQVGNFMVFILGPILPSIWLLYVHLQIFSDEEKTLKLIRPLAIISSIHGILVILNLYNGWIYYIDENNIYHRGALIAISAGLAVILVIITSIMIIINRHRTEDRYYFSLLFFGFPPFASIGIQYLFYGTSLVLNSVVVSLLIIFLNIQNQSIYTDHLTGVYNRKMLEKYLNTKARTYNLKKPFAAIMVDLNDFKEINDNYGHDVGDEALQVMANILKKSIKCNDFISRFGGDEFCLVLNVADESELKTIVNRIQRNVDKYNESGIVPYKLCCSMGYSLYNDITHQKIEEFQKHIDCLMYENKQMKNSYKAFV